MLIYYHLDLENANLEIIYLGTISVFRFLGARIQVHISRNQDRLDELVLVLDS